jgi:HAD superfamily hydrolase (TIGR01490 family)
VNAQPFAVFDIDGTLVRWQLYHAVVDRLAKYDLLGTEAHQTLHRARMVWKRREHRDAFRAYELELIKVYEAALPDLDTKTFDKIAQEVVEEYKTQVYAYTRNLVQKLKSEGYFLIAISGSHQELVEHVAKQYGFDDWVGTRYERKGTRFTGKKYVASFDKKSILSTCIKRHQLHTEGSYGVGDSASDTAILEMVEHPIAFNPDFELLNIAKEHGWQIVVERKNVIYELLSQNGIYKLKLN